MESSLGIAPSHQERAPYEYVTVTIVESGETFQCRTWESLLDGMRRLDRRGIPVGCRGGGCSVCKIEILSGSYQQIRAMSREYVSDEDLAADRVLACCVRPLENVTLRVIGKLRRALGGPGSVEQRQKI